MLWFEHCIQNQVELRLGEWHDRSLHSLQLNLLMPKVKFESNFKKKSNKLIQNVFKNPNSLLNPLIVSCLFQPSPAQRHPIVTLSFATKSSISNRTTSGLKFAYISLNAKWLLRIRGKLDTRTWVGIEFQKSKSPIVFLILTQLSLNNGYNICEIASPILGLSAFFLCLTSNSSRFMKSFMRILSDSCFIASCISSLTSLMIRPI